MTEVKIWLTIKIASKEANTIVDIINPLLFFSAYWSEGTTGSYLYYTITSEASGVGLMLIHVEQIVAIRVFA